MKYFMCKDGKTREYSFPRQLKNGTSLKIFETENKVIIQPYLAPHLAHKQGTKPGYWVMTPERYVISFRNNKAYLYKLNNSNGEFVKRIYQHNMLDLFHFEHIVMTYCAGAGGSGIKGMGYYLWICKFLHSKMIQNNVPVPPKIKFKAFKIYQRVIIGPLTTLLQYQAYPMFRDLYHYENKRYMAIPKFMSKYLRKTNSIKKLSQYVFGGSTKYTVDVLNKAVRYVAHDEHNGISMLSWAQVLKGLIPIDWYPIIAPAINETNPINVAFIGCGPKEIRAFLSQFSQKKLLHLITSQYEEEFYHWDGPLKGKHDKRMKYAFHYIVDTVRNWYPYRDKIPLPDMNNMRDLHDYISKEHRKLEHKNLPIKLDKKYIELDGKQVKDLTIVFPKQTHDLIEWGQTMHNCIGGYGNMVYRNQTMVCAIVQEGKMLYNLEIQDRHIRQFHAAHNRPADPYDEAIIIDTLKTHKVIA